MMCSYRKKYFFDTSVLFFGHRLLRRTLHLSVHCSAIRQQFNLLGKYSKMKIQEHG
jgi:hypothetical protein